MCSKPDPESHDHADERQDADTISGYVFTTLAFEYQTGRFPPAGFFCLWDDQLTFVHSNWVQFVIPIPLIGMLLPNAVLPTGPDDSRTRTGIPYADIEQATSYKGARTHVHTRSGKDYYFGGAEIDREFHFERASEEIATALKAAGYTVTVTDDALTVLGHRTQDRRSDL